MVARELGLGSLDDFVKRTNEGVDATVVAFKRALKEPERLAFFALHDLGYAARIFNWQRVLKVAEPALLPMLAGSICRSDRPLREKVPAAEALAAATIAGLGKSRHPQDPTVGAVLADTLEHASYARALNQRFRTTLDRDGIIGRAAIVGAGALIAAVKNKKAVVPSLLGGAALVAATQKAQDPKLRRQGVTGRGIGHGANMILVSEALTLIRATKNRRTLGTRVLEATAASLAALGQMLLIDGLMRRP